MILRGSIFSKALEMTTGVSLVAPKDRAGNDALGVCYLLHGLAGGNGDFIDYSRLVEYAETRNTLFVMPEVGRSFYTDMRRGQNFFQYVAFELPELCARTFNVSRRREDVMIAGTSMGGYGALKCALTRSDLYGRCAAFSPPLLFVREGLAAMRTPEGARMIRETHGERLFCDFQAIFGDDFEWNPDCDLLALAEKAATRPVRPDIYMACGDADSFLADVRRFGERMEGLSYRCAREEWQGGHNWFFFDEALRRALEWNDGLRAG